MLKVSFAALSASILMLSVVSKKVKMKKLLFVFPLLALMGCVAAPKPVAINNDSSHECATIAVARGTTGQISYSCEQLSCASKNILFSCSFHNETNQTQPGLAIKIVLFSQATNRQVLSSEVIYADPIEAGQTSIKTFFWDRSRVESVCGPNMERCVFLTQKVWPPSN